MTFGEIAPLLHNLSPALTTVILAGWWLWQYLARRDEQSKGELSELVKHIDATKDAVVEELRAIKTQLEEVRAAQSKQIVGDKLTRHKLKELQATLGQQAKTGT